MVLLEQRPDAEVAIVHGVDDEDVPVSLSRRLAEAHPWVQLHEIDGDHDEVIAEAGETFDLVLGLLNVDPENS